MTYQSPFSYRYGSDEMRALWSEKAKRILWRKIWVTTAEVLSELELVRQEQVADLKSQETNIDLERAHEIEEEIKHDLMAELKTFSEQCPQGGAILHWGLTSADVKDNADILLQRAGLTILLRRLKDLLIRFTDLIDETANITVMGYTHLQPAEPTSLGYRLANYAQAFNEHFDSLAILRKSLRGKGIRGAVGTAATFKDMLRNINADAEAVEARVMELLGLDVYPISGQTYPRIQDFTLLTTLASLSASLHKFAFDVRILQAPGLSTISEPFGEKQVGSSAMPFKRNPIKAEKVCSLARFVGALPSVAWHNAANSLLERTLDDSANRRSILPDAYLACDEMLLTALTIVDGLQVDKRSIDETIERYGTFSATERLLTALVQSGADRQQMHERLRQHSQRAWEALLRGEPNPLADSLCADTAILKYLQPVKVRSLLDVQSYMGLGPEKARRYSSQIREKFASEAKNET
jgi:adenylosuccinate lyase